MGDDNVSTQPFHEGELAVQERAGAREIAHRTGAIVSSRIVPGALPFLAAQRLLAVSITGDDGHLWTSVWFGEPGFVHSADGRRVSIRPSLMTASPDDPARGRLTLGRDVGFLAIELASRRRLRINGTIDGLSADEISVRVRESLPNCPKYIQRRHARDVSASPRRRRRGEWGRTVDEERRALLSAVDTAFVGSLHPARGVDASHRGGAPGFIEVVDPAVLRVPDFPGNSMFTTLGNYAVDSRASLAAVDFDRGRLVSFSGSARLRFGVENPQHPTGGTGRYWDLAVREWVQFELPSSQRWDLLDSSPFNPPLPGK